MRYLILLISMFSLAQNSKLKEAQEFQKKLNAEFTDSITSPLLPKDLKEFKGLYFFSIDTNYVVKAKFFKSKNQKTFKMKTTGDRTPTYRKFGELHFELDGQKLVLNVYQNIELLRNPKYKDYLFLPFSDETNGKETYIGGRYIDLKIPKTDTIILDFNQAYNPYCAYNYKYSCPIVPLENDLKVAINAGVKKFHD